MIKIPVIRLSILISFSNQDPLIGSYLLKEEPQIIKYSLQLSVQLVTKLQTTLHGDILQQSIHLQRLLHQQLGEQKKSFMPILIWITYKASAVRFQSPFNAEQTCMKLKKIKNAQGLLHMSIKMFINAFNGWYSHS